LQGDDLLLIWNDEWQTKIPLPSIICTPNGKSKEFLAWTSTYIKHLRPFTAFSRVMDVEEFENARKAVIKSPLFPDALLGMIIGEVIDLKKLGIVRYSNTMAAKNTLSYAIAMAVAQGSPYKKSEIVRRFENCRKLTRNPYPYQLLNNLLNIWQNYLQSKNFPDEDYINSNLGIKPIYDLLRSFSNRIEVTKIDIENVFQNQINIPEIPVKSQRIEHRVESFEAACKAITGNTRTPPQLASFSIALIANLISPGTMSHSALLDQFCHTYPGLFTWYGLCAGLSPETTISGYEQGFGWRILRQLLAKYDILNHSFSDICYNELELLLSLEKPDIIFNTDYGNYLSIELVPGVSTLIPWQISPQNINSNKSLTSQESQQLNIFNEKEIAPSIDSLGKKLYELLDIYEQITNHDLKSSYSRGKGKSRSGTKGKAKSF
jgi:hypothetical protein